LLLAMRRTEEAELLLEEAQQHFPKEPMVSILHARLAEARSDWAEAGRRWEAIRTNLPAQAEGWSGGVRCLSRMGQVAAADVLADQGVALFPADAGLAFAWADAPKGPGNDLTLRAERWTQVHTRFPEHPGSFAACALALRDLGDIAQAKLVAAEGCSKFPGERDVFRAYGIVLLAAEELVPAEQALAKALQIGPDDVSTRLHYIRAAVARKDWWEVTRRIADAQKSFPSDGRFHADQFALPAGGDTEAIPPEAGMPPAAGTPKPPRVPKPTGRLRRLLKRK
jgi:Flp pilus assembly protein TadD